MASISKDILFLRMAMKIQEHLYSISIFENQLLYADYLWSYMRLRVFPLPVQIVAVKVASRIAHNNSIWIQHGDYFDNEILQQIISALEPLETCKSIKDTLDNKRASCFHGVCSGSDKNDFLSGLIVLGRNRNNINTITQRCPT